jgi:hypothetical protein
MAVINSIAVVRIQRATAAIGTLLPVNVRISSD